MRRYSGWWLPLVLSLQACGYGPVRSDVLFGASRIALMPFAESNSVGLAPLMADHLARLLQADGVVLTLDPDRAQAVLDGRIDVATRPSATRAGIQSFQLSAVIHAELHDRDGKVLWSGGSSASEDFLPVLGSDVQPLFTETNRRFAIHRLAEQAAHRVHAALSIGEAIAPPAVVSEELPADAPQNEDSD